MSIIQQHTAATLSDAWRTIDIDALDPDSSVNFDTTTLHPPLPETSEADVRQINAQVRQLLRGGDAEGALRGCLEMPVYSGSDGAKVRPPLFLPGPPSCLRVQIPILTVVSRQDAHLQTVIEVLQSIKASDMTLMLQRIYPSPGGS